MGHVILYAPNPNRLVSKTIFKDSTAVVRSETSAYDPGRIKTAISCTGRLFRHAYTTANIVYRVNFFFFFRLKPVCRSSRYDKPRNIIRRRVQMDTGDLKREIENNTVCQ